MSQGKNYIWSSKAEELMLHILCEAIVDGVGKTPDGKIRQDTFLDVVAKFNQTMDPKITKAKLDSRWKTWKTMYKNYTIIMNQSGWGPDFVKGHTDVEKEVWDDFVEVNPSFLMLILHVLA